MPDSYRDIADAVGLLGYWSANDLYEESDYVRCTCTNAAEAINEMRERLSAYADAEEQGRLVMFPCKVNDTVFVITERGFIAKGEVRNFRFFDKLIVDVEYHHFGTWATSRYWGETVFLTREEAEAALKGEREDV